MTDQTRAAVRVHTQQLQWTVIPALPGTRMEWEAEWCKAGTVPVHAWLIQLDIEPRQWNDDDAYGRVWDIDTSSAVGYPMVLAADGCIQDARYADLDGKRGEVIEP
jgi:hypothetical protein